MEANLIKTGTTSIIQWEDENQFGEITFKWDAPNCKYIVDSEMLSVETIIKIIKSIK